MRIKIGDVVRLKSGGPKMTVQWLYPTDEAVRCSWFKGLDIQEAVFRVESLKVVK